MFSKRADMESAPTGLYIFVGKTTIPLRQPSVATSPAGRGEKGSPCGRAVERMRDWEGLKITIVKKTLSRFLEKAQIVRALPWNPQKDTFEKVPSWLPQNLTIWLMFTHLPCRVATFLKKAPLDSAKTFLHGFCLPIYRAAWPPFEKVPFWIPQNFTIWLMQTHYEVFCQAFYKKAGRGGH